MRIGIMAGATGGDDGLDALVASAKDFEARGFDTMWMANIFGIDAITAAAIIGRETETIGLGTAVVPTYPRHPTALAQQALTAQAASAGRFALGIGLSHKVVIEDMLGLSYARRAKHMREYMAVLGPLLRGEPAKFEGEEYRVNLALAVPGATPVPTLIAALGDHMLRIAGETADGTILWMTGPDTIESHIGPKLRSAAADSGRPEPRVVAGLPMKTSMRPEKPSPRFSSSMASFRAIARCSTRKGLRDRRTSRWSAMKKSSTRNFSAYETSV